MNDERVRKLSDRCKRFAVRVVRLLRKLPLTAENREIGRQLIRASSSPGANYIEAQSARTTSEFYSTVKISLREANESVWWLEILVEINDKQFHEEIIELVHEGKELSKIFAAIYLRRSRVDGFKT